MASSLNVNSLVVTLQGGTTYYLHYPSAYQSLGSSTEGNHQTKLRTAGTVSKLLVYVSSGNFGGTSVVRTRLNGSNGGLSVSIGSGATGAFEDTSGSDTIAAGDLYCYQAVPAGTAGNILGTRHISTLFAASSNTSKRLGGAPNAGISTASQTSYLPVGGGTGSSTTTEATVLMTARVGGVLKNLAIYVSANTRTTAGTFRNRKAGSNGALSVSVTGSTTGWFEDTSNSDTYSSGNTISFSYTSGTGTGTTTVRHYGADFESTDGSWLSMETGSTGNANGPSVTRYFVVEGGAQPESTEALVAVKTRMIMTAVAIGGRVISNSISAASTGTLRKSGADTSLSFSITANTTGFFEDTSPNETYSATDTINHKLVTGGSGTSMNMFWSLNVTQITAVTVNSSRDAEVTGKDTSNAARAARVTGVSQPVLTAVQDGAEIDLSWTYTPIP